MEVLFAVPPARGGRKPPFVVPPLGLLYLAGACLGSGHKAQLLDAPALGLSWEEFETRVRSSSARVAALTGMTPTWDITRRAAQVLKNAGKTVVVGGPHITMRGSSFFKTEENFPADAAVVGEGESVFASLLETMENNGDASRLSGVVTPGGYTPPAAPLRDIDRLPYPARRLLDHAGYSYPPLGPGPATTLFTSRGCPHACIFCDKSVFGSAPRLHSADRVMEELRQIACDAGVRSVIIYDDLFTLDKKRVIEICRRIVGEGLPVRWKCEARADEVDPDMLDWMSRAGCRIVSYGIETIHEKSLRFLRKGASPDDAARAIAMTRRAGMDVLAYFLIGIPGERLEHVEQTARFAARWGVSWAQFSVLSPVEGTPLYEMAQKKGWYAVADVMNPFDADLARPALTDDYWTPQRLKKALRAAHMTFYARPSYVVSRLARAGGARGALNLLSRGMELAGWMRKTKK